MLGLAVHVDDVCLFVCLVTWCGASENTPVGELLTLSLREEELNISLQTLEDGLVQARMALQAAYMEVQRLLVVKQQVRCQRFCGSRDMKHLPVPVCLII